ncbi:hypothetical protein [Halorussus salinus]|nr:hypothetical protein [Halorussus salinus]
MEHDTTSDETTEEMNAGCGGAPYYPDACIPPQYYDLFAKFF